MKKVILIKGVATEVKNNKPFVIEPQNLTIQFEGKNYKVDYICLKEK